MANPTRMWRHELRDKEVRELAWAIGGPGLMGPIDDMDVVRTDEFSGYLDHAYGWLTELDADPAPLHDALAQQPNWKVGLRFETLIGYWLAASSPYSLVGREIQVQHERQTLGAFDFLVRTSTGQLEHWEVAIKYYLQKDPSPSWDAWVGPNARDRLDLKLHRMAGHQLPLSERAEGRRTLAELGCDEPVTRRAWVKGMFFSPWTGPTASPQHAESGEPRGIWLRQSELDDYTTQWPDSRWLAREKPHWLAPAADHREESMTSEAWLAAMMKTPLARPEMVSRLCQSTSGLYLEDARLFVVQDMWPARPSP